MSVVNGRWFCARHPRLFALVVSAALSACGADRSSPSDEPSARSGQRLDLAELEQHIGPPLIRLAPGYTPADCQKPSRMPDSVERADEELACRKMKIVQHHLNFLMTGRTRRANAEQLAGQGAADRRRQALFGRYFTTHLQNNTLPGQSCDDACVRRAVKGCDDACAAELSAAGVDAELAKSSGFDSDLRDAFQRMLAVLIASTAPIDRDDGVEGWWWELPPEYRTNCGVPAGEKCLAERAQLMRDDVNAWITSSGLWVYANTGTPDGLPDVSVEGDLDFVLLELIHFMYALKDRPKLLTDAAVEALVLKRWTEQEIDPMETLKARAHTVFARWAESNVPFAGQEIRRELVASQHVPLLNIGLSETENHVLMTLAHYYLMNQWISQDYRGNLSAIVQPPAGFTADDWFSHGNGALRAMVRDALARPMHSGFFENNARPYQGYTFHALLAFASYAEDETIRTEAESALHFLSSQFAFQSLEGRRSTPMRRNCEQADQLVMYNRDGTAFGLGVLTGAYKWNDSPYGYRPSLSAPDVCFQGTTPACHWPEFTWKTDASANDSTDPQTPADRRGEKIAQGPDELADDFPGPQPKALWAAFSDYRVPRAVHAFMLDKGQGYFARMMPRYDRGAYSDSHYRFGLSGGPWDQGSLEEDDAASELSPRYFDGDEAFDSGDNNERTPEFYFAGPGFLNVAGGIYNPYYTTLGVSHENSYFIPSNPHLNHASLGCNHDAFGEKLENYDNLSRPYTILSEVPAYQKRIPTARRGLETITVYRPFGTNETVSFEEANAHVPMMRGDSDDWFKSANVATYKNFSYGYRLRDTGPGTYAELGGEFPQDIPPIWLACDASQSPDPAICPAPIETREFEFGDPWSGERAAIFKLYDLREFMAAQGQTGFFLVTARVRKFRVELWSTRIARGFWEVVPADKFEDVDELAEAVQDGNDPGAFSLFYGVINQDFRYRLVTSGEVVHLDQEFGALYSDPVLQTFDEGRVQGIIGVEDSNGANNSLANLFQRFMDDGVMNELPLIDVKAVDHDFDFQTHDDDRYVYYACAKDGWLFVNNVSDGSYLFVDTRRGSGFEDHPTLPTPYWQSGHFGDRTPWSAQCGAGNGTWTPAPPQNGIPDDCSNPEMCPPDDGGDGGQGGGNQGGASGRGGQAGSSGRGGASGQAGSSGGGASGQAGSSGRGGASGQAGSSGGHGGAGSGGSGGQCAQSSGAVCLTPSQCPVGELCLAGQCVCRPPDLVPEKPAADVPGFGSGHCLNPPTGGAAVNVRVRVRNAGTSSADPSLVTIRFEGNIDEVRAIPALAPGAFVDRTVPIPAGCYDGWVCEFSVTVDSAFQVVEVSENNNLAEGACFAPAG